MGGSCPCTSDRMNVPGVGRKRRSLAGTRPSLTTRHELSNGWLRGLITADRECCPGLYVDRLQSIADVTARIRAKVTASTAAQRVEQRDAESRSFSRPATNCRPPSVTPTATSRSMRRARTRAIHSTAMYRIPRTRCPTRSRRRAELGNRIAAGRRDQRG